MLRVSSTAQAFPALYTQSITVKGAKMARLLAMSAAMILATGAGASFAQSGADVVKSKCTACHEVDKKKIGPAFKDVAAKYKGDKAAEAKLVEKIKEGKGHAKIPASDAELKAAVQHVLATK
jgi:cytochrome c